jgi:hypothetical protein
MPIMLPRIQNTPPSGGVSHQRQPGNDSGQAEQGRDADREPIENLDDRGRNEPIPLKQVAIIKHLNLPRPRRRRLFPQFAHSTHGRRVVNRGLRSSPQRVRAEANILVVLPVSS